MKLSLRHILDVASVVLSDVGAKDLLWNVPSSLLFFSRLRGQLGRSCQSLGRCQGRPEGKQHLTYSLEHRSPQVLVVSLFCPLRSQGAECILRGILLTVQTVKALGFDTKSQDNCRVFLVTSSYIFTCYFKHTCYRVYFPAIDSVEIFEQVIILIFDINH